MKIVYYRVTVSSTSKPLLAEIPYHYYEIIKLTKGVIFEMLIKGEV